MKKKVVIIICLSAVALILVGGAAFGYRFMSSPKQIFHSNINHSFKAINKMRESYNTVDSQVSFKISANAIDESFGEVGELLENASLNIRTQMDNMTDELILDVSAGYNNENLLDAKAYYTKEHSSSLYFYVGELFDKYLELTAAEELGIDIDSIFSSIQSSEEQLKNQKTAMNILQEEIKNQISVKEFHKSKEEIELQGKVEKVNKSTLILSEQEYLEILKNICENLAKNDQFLACFEEIEEVKEVLLDLAEDLQFEVEYADEDITLEISIYTKGLLNEVVQVEVWIEDTYLEERTGVRIIIPEKGTYEFKLVSEYEGERQEAMSGIVKIETQDKNTGKFSISLTIPDMGTVLVELSYTTKYNVEIEKIDISNAVNVEDLTEEDMTELLENLEKMPIYQYLEPYISNPLTGSEIQVYDVGNYIKTDNEKYIVSFSVPDTFKPSFVNNAAYRAYEDDNYNSVLIASSIYRTVEEYFKWVEEEYEESLENESCSNQNLSDVSTMTVNGKTFYYRVLTYKWYEEDYQEIYLCYAIDDEMVLEIEITQEPQNGITHEELETFLTIEIEQI